MAYLRKLSTEQLEESDFRQTALAFESMSGRNITTYFSEDIEMSATDGFKIWVRAAFPELGTNYLSYLSYVSFQHELAHILFKSSTEKFAKFVKSHKSQKVAKAVFNIAEDERVEVLWNQIYLTPFREFMVKRRTWRIQQEKKGMKLDVFDIMFDVRGQIKRSTDAEYLRLWEEVDTILDNVRGIDGKGNISMSSTERAAEALYLLVLENPDPDTEANQDDTDTSNEKEVNKKTKKANKESGKDKKQKSKPEKQQSTQEAAKEMLERLKGKEGEEEDSEEEDYEEEDYEEDEEDSEDGDEESEGEDLSTRGENELDIDCDCEEGEEEDTDADSGDSDGEEEESEDSDVDSSGDSEEDSEAEDSETEVEAGDNPTGDGGEGQGAGGTSQERIEELESDEELLEQLEEKVEELEQIDPSITAHNEMTADEDEDEEELDESDEESATQHFMQELSEEASPKFEKMSPEEILDIYPGLRKAGTKLPIVRHEATLEIKTKTKEWLDEEGDALDVEELIYKRLSGDNKVPIWKEERKDFGIDVSFVLDLSGSMGDNDCKVMFSAAWSIWSALEKLANTTIKAIGYDSERSVELIEDKEAMLYYRGNGGTASAEALEYAMLKMEQSAGARMIIHVTDGGPNNAEYVKEVMDKIRRKGIYVFTILIGQTQNEHIENIYGPGDSFACVPTRVNEVQEMIQDKIFPLVTKYVKMGSY